MYHLILTALWIAAVGSHTHTILPLGDSITFGCGDTLAPSCVAEGRGTKCNIISEDCAPCVHGYRLRLFDILNSSEPGKFKFVGTLQTGPQGCDHVLGSPCLHEGHPGWTTTDIERIIDTTVKGLAPDFVLLHIGTNDIGKNHYKTPQEAAEATTQNLRRLLHRLFHVLPTVHVFLASIVPMPRATHFYPRAAGLNLTAQQEAYNAQLPHVANLFGATRVTFVDMNREAGFKIGPDFCPSGLHPDGTGYAKMAKVWANTLQAYGAKELMKRGEAHIPTYQDFQTIPDGTAITDPFIHQSGMRSASAYCLLGALVFGSLLAVGARQCSRHVMSHVSRECVLE